MESYPLTTLADDWLLHSSDGIAVTRPRDMLMKASLWSERVTFTIWGVTLPRSTEASSGPNAQEMKGLWTTLEWLQQLVYSSSLLDLTGNMQMIFTHGDFCSISNCRSSVWFGR